jgi:phospholipase C
MPDPQQVVVVSFENRSFDHMLGFVAPAGTLDGTQYNLVDPGNTASQKVYVSPTAGPITSTDPNHSFEGVDEQLFGTTPGHPDPAPMSGFVSNYTRTSGGDVSKGGDIMRCQSAATIPVFSGLAASYCVCTRWFSSVPGPTWPNRYFMHAATSWGLVTMNRMLDENAHTIFDELDAFKPEDGSLSWRVYAGDIPQCLAIESLAKRFVEERAFAPQDRHFHSLGQFFSDLSAGSLPAYSFIEPAYFDTPLGKATDGHPPHDMRDAEALLAQVYTGLQASTYWEHAMLLVLFDEHGGFYDSKSPPTHVPPPDSHVSTQPAFDFTRLGLRVPAVIISPFVEKGRIDSTTYDHSAIPATLNAVFGLGPENLLTDRDRWSQTFQRNLDLAAPRPTADLFQADMAGAPSIQAITQVTEPREAIVQTKAAALRQEQLASVSDLSTHQRSLLELADVLIKETP